jgi:hypothetical protein
VISCGANVPFADKEIFFGPIAEHADNAVSVIPDFVANCGMARVFAFLMEDDIEVSDKAIFTDVSETIGNAIAAIRERNTGRTGISKTAFEIALEQLL